MSNEAADEISVKDFVNKLKSVTSYLKSKWLTILCVSIITSAVGLVYSIVKKTVYTASSTFVLEDGNKGGGLGQYASLASLAGIDLGGGGGGGMFQGDNILQLYKSRLMIEKTLLSEASFNGKNQLLIDRYIEFNKLRDKWKDNSSLAGITFKTDPAGFTRQQDSIISDIVKKFNKQVLTVAKPDKKIAIIKVDVTNKDELFAMQFNLKLVQNVNDFYTQTKTKKSDQNVRVLQRQADSVKRVLNSSITGVASALDAAPNANPALQVLRVPSQKRQIDVQANSAIYAEIVKNLEISKVSLRQETPLIQLIDSPVLPLETDKLSKIAAVIGGLFLGAFLTSLVLATKKLLKE
jgi:hypothetical protein